MNMSYIESDVSRTYITEPDPNKTPLLIMTVDIGEGLKDNIIIYTDSCIENVVEEFAAKYNLVEDQANTLINQIHENLYDENTEPEEITRNEYFRQWHNHIDKHLSQEPPHRPKINKNSMRIMSQRQVKPVFERLYSQTHKNREAPSEIKIKKAGTQCGNRLYNNWMVKQKLRDQERSRVEEQKEEEITKELTFKPNINKNISISSYFKQDPGNFQKIKEENIERKRFELLAKEQENCTFVPQINPISEELVQNRLKTNGKNKFLELYEEATLRKEKNEELVEQ